MASADSIDPANGEDRKVHAPALTVITGLTYWEQSQVFKRWLLPTYRTSFLWTGNRPDAEDMTTWVFKNVAARTQLPEPVNAVDDRVADATLDAVGRHWSDRYGVARPRCSEMYAVVRALGGRPAMTLSELSEGLSAEMRLVIVLRFLRRRPLAAIAGAPPGTAHARLYAALLVVADRIGFDAGPGDNSQADQVATFVNDLIRKGRPLRFEALPSAWAALQAAAHIQAAVAGNNLPRVQFVRSVEETLGTGPGRRPVTHLRIWTA
jgi:hypothetical protein